MTATTVSQNRVRATGSPATRALHLIAGIAAAVAAVAVAGPWVLALWLLPDVALVGAFAGGGRLKPSAVGRYNAVHMLPPAVALTTVGLVAGPVVLGLGLIWVSHVLADRGMGYGLRAPDGWQRG